MTAIAEPETQLQVHTSRREVRERYIRFYLKRSGMADTDIDEYLSTKQAVLENKSILELIYSGEYTKATQVVEELVDELDNDASNRA